MIWWNVIALGNICISVCIGHVDFMLFVSFSPLLLPNVKVFFGGMWAFFSSFFFNVYFTSQFTSRSSSVFDIF